MKYIIPCLLTIALTSCSGDNNNAQTTISPIETVRQVPPTSTDKFEFINTKTEQAGSNVNTMEHYSVVGKLDMEALKKLCADRKGNFASGTFFYIVIFDDKKNAAFPSDPFTAAYGMEKKKMKHIKAFYTFNKKNGYSKLGTYKKNMYDSAVDEIDI